MLCMMADGYQRARSGSGIRSITPYRWTMTLLRGHPRDIHCAKGSSVRKE